MAQIRKVASHAEPDPGILTAAERLQYQGFQRRQQTNALIQRMGREGVPIKRIVRIAGLGRRLVRRLLRGEREDVFRLRQNSLTPWFPDLESYWQDGCRSILVTQVEHALPALSQARRLLDAFTTMVRNGDTAAMAGWLEEASGSEMARSPAASLPTWMR